MNKIGPTGGMREFENLTDESCTAKSPNRMRKHIHIVCCTFREENVQKPLNLFCGEMEIIVNNAGSERRFRRLQNNLNSSIFFRIVQYVQYSYNCKNNCKIGTEIFTH